MSDARPPSAPRTPPPGPRSNLRHLDSALAEDVDQLLDGSFETVHSILADLAEAAEPDPEPAPEPPLPAARAAVPESPPEPRAERPDPARLFGGDEAPEEDLRASPGAPSEEWVADAEASWGTSGFDEALPVTGRPEPAPVLAVKVVLAVLSLPLRVVPVSMRSALDWLALSLLFWVPIVWTVVWLMARGE